MRILATRFEEVPVKPMGAGRGRGTEDGTHACRHGLRFYTGALESKFSVTNSEGKTAYVRKVRTKGSHSSVI